ncbi:hypothetical protein VP01_2559g2, partial [Puccinia sorghi]
ILQYVKAFSLRGGWFWGSGDWVRLDHNIKPVKNNGPLMGGVMWANSWMKSLKKEDKAASFREANNWIATHLEKLAPGVLEQYHQLLLVSELPSFAHMKPRGHGLQPLDSRGRFTLGDFQVYLDLNNGASPSDRYTRLVFLCWMSEKISNAVVAYINAKKKAHKLVSGQQVQIENAEAKLAKKQK